MSPSALLQDQFRQFVNMTEISRLERSDRREWEQHYRAMPSPLRGAEDGFLDDLSVDPYRDGDGTGEAIIGRVDQIAVIRGWGVVRWITGDNNYRTRGLYDGLSQRSGWITYEMTAATTGLEVK